MNRRVAYRYYEKVWFWSCARLVMWSCARSCLSRSGKKPAASEMTPDFFFLTSCVLFFVSLHLAVTHTCPPPPPLSRPAHLVGRSRLSLSCFRVFVLLAHNLLDDVHHQQATQPTTNPPDTRTTLEIVPTTRTNTDNIYHHEQQHQHQQQQQTAARLTT